MNIKKKLRDALLKEGKHSDSKYGCVMVYFKYDKTDWKAMQDLIEEDDLYNPKEETGYGREKNPHATVLYGLPSDMEDEIVEKKIDLVKKPDIKLGKVSKFDNDDFDVLKFEVVSDDMHALNKEFGKLPHHNDFPNYEPHCTIAYVKKGLAKKYIDILNGIDKLVVEADKIVYSKADGEQIDYPLK